MKLAKKHTFLCSLADKIPIPVYRTVSGSISFWNGIITSLTHNELLVKDDVMLQAVSSKVYKEDSLSVEILAEITQGMGP